MGQRTGTRAAGRTIASIRTSLTVPTRVLVDESVCLWLSVHIGPLANRTAPPSVSCASQTVGVMKLLGGFLDPEIVWRHLCRLPYSLWPRPSQRALWRATEAEANAVPILKGPCKPGSSPSTSC